MKSIFSSLLRRETPPKQTEDAFTLPYGLTQEEFNSLKALAAHPSFSILRRVLDEVVKLKGEMMLQSSKVEALHFLRGYVAGTRDAAALIDRMEVAEQHHIRTNRKREDVGQRNPRAALFGTPGWRDLRDSSS